MQNVGDGKGDQENNDKAMLLQSVSHGRGQYALCRQAESQWTAAFDEKHAQRP